MNYEKPLEESTCKARNSIAADLLAGKEVSAVSYNPATGRMEQTYGTTDFRKRLSELRIDYGMNIDFRWEPNVGNKGRHKIHYMTADSIRDWVEKHKITI